jgi:hypothetical protein
MDSDQLARRAMLTGALGAAAMMGLGSDVAGAQTPSPFQPPRRGRD